MLSLSWPRRLIGLLIILACSLPFFHRSVAVYAWQQGPVTGSMVPAEPSQPAFLEQEVGQHGGGEGYSMALMGGRLWVTDDSLWLSLLEEPQGDETWPADGTVDGVHVRLSFLDSNPASELQPFGALPVHVSYLHGQDRDEWVAEVPVWQGVRYRNLYPGIDLVVDAQGGRGIMPWRLEAQPQANLEGVRLQVEGVEGVVVSGNSLQLQTGVGEVRLALPVATGGRPGQPVTDERVRQTSAGVFEIGGPYARNAAAKKQESRSGEEDLIYSTFLGGSSWEIANDIAGDSAGNGYVAGRTPSIDFPVTPGAFDLTVGQVDGFVAKVNADGSGLIYATYLGGSGMDSATGIDVSGDAAYVTGETDSIDFPLAGTTEGENDVFVVALNATGADVTYSVLIGGRDQDKGFAIAVDGSNAFVTGTTFSRDFPGGKHLGEFDAFALKVTADGVLAYARRLGGRGDDLGLGIATLNGEAYVIGQTDSTSFQGVPTVGGGDAFAVKVTNAGGVGYVRILGGSGLDRGQAIAVDAAGGAHLVGSTASADFPVTTGSFAGGTYDAFVARLDVAGNTSYASFLGGSGWEEARGIAVEAPGVVDVAGFTNSADFPVTSDAYDQTWNGNHDLFAARLDLNGATPAQPVYATYLGGSNEDKGYGMAMDSLGLVYLTGFTRSGDFPVTPGALQGSLNGTRDAFVSKVRLLTRAVAAAKTVEWNRVTPDPSQMFTICASGPSFATPDCQQVGYLGGVVSWMDVLPGSYTITENDPGEQWSVTIGGSPATVPADGGIASASVLNARKVGSLEVTKTVDWNGVAPDPAQTFEVCINGPSYPDGDCQTVNYLGHALVWPNLTPGSYTVSESDPGPQWETTIEPYLVVIPDKGGTLLSDVINTRRLGSLEATKTVAWNGITPDPAQTFEICISGPSYPDGDCQTAGYQGGALSWSDLIPGDYEVTETDPGVAWEVDLSGSPATVPEDGGSTVAAVVNTRNDPGDCNGDGTVDAGDISACVLEIFDGDGDDPANAAGGTFVGTPFCDSNEDGKIDAGDISCTVLLIFDGPNACGGSPQTEYPSGTGSIIPLEDVSVE
ncbi:MAG: hypothetical protein U9R25_11790 [Chloroflexota bacterium]|nr:hypothetical protein [Chloroflexota bacterium]